VKGVAVILVALALTGCAAAPDRIDLDWFHASHPLLGPPFGPSEQEDTLDVLGPRARWERGRYYFEAGIGQQMKDSGFYGDGIIFTSHVGVTLWSRK
jgi:hypothetical protein